MKNDISFQRQEPLADEMDIAYQKVSNAVYL